MENNKHKEILSRIEKSISAIKNKESVLYFFVADAKNTPNAKMEYVYELAYTLHEKKYNVCILYQLDNEYTEKTIKKHEKFISLLNKSQNDNEFLGKWELIDAKTKETVDKFSFYTGSSFEIQKYNSYLEYHCNSNMSFIYTDGKEFYFYPSVHFSFIKRMILINDELYFYILQDNNWILDPIHENGLYYYSKQ